MEAQCIICMEPYQSSCVGREQNDGSINASCVVKVLPCKHFFHDECISNWLTVSAFRVKDDSVIN